MKSRNITSLFMGESKYGNSIAVFRALLLATIFVVGIMSSMGSIGASKASLHAARYAEGMDNAELQNEIKYCANKISKLHRDISAIYAQRDARNKKQGYETGCSVPEKRNLRTIIRKIDVLEAERDAYQAQLSLNTGCFTPETKILMADGSLKNISDVVVGDILKSYNEETGRLVATNVVKTYKFNQNHYYLINKGIKITAKHRFLTDSGWKRACDLKVSDKIKSQGKFIEVGSIDLIAPLDIKVYNLEVDKHHSFLVSDGVDPYVVHNSCGGGDGDGDGDITK